MRYLCLIFVCLLLLQSTRVEAQVLSSKKRFSVDYNQGCIPYEVKINTIFQSQKNIIYVLYHESDKTLDNPAPSPLIIDKAEKLLLVQLIEDPPLGESVSDTLEIFGYNATAPQFTAYTCSNLGGVALISDRTYDYYGVSFGSGPAVRADASTNYKATGQFQEAGTKEVTVRGFYNNAPNNCGETVKTLEAKPQLPKPRWNGLQWNQASGEVSLQYSLDPQVRYQLERLNPSSGSYESVFLISGSSIDTTFIQPDLSSQYFCYRIKALDECFGNDVVSEPLCTAVWSVAAHEGYNEIQYQTHNSFAGTVELTSGYGIFIASSTTASGTLNEEDVICGQNYCYQLQLRYQQTDLPPAVSYPPICVESQSRQALPALRNITSVWSSNEQLTFHPQCPLFYSEFNLTLQNNEGARIAAAKGDSLSIRAIPAETCYQFTYSSDCGTRATTSTPVCPLYLRTQSGEPDVFIPVWNSYTGYADGVQYYVLEELNAAGQVINEWNTGRNTTFTDFPPFTINDNGRRFRVLAYPEEANIAPSVSNIFAFELVMKGYFPNAFSPNGDGLNDEFKIMGKFVEQASISVYNRWGEQLFHTTDKDLGWNGTFRGKPAPEGNYVYKAEVVTADGRKAVLTGTIFLKR